MKNMKEAEVYGYDEKWKKDENDPEWRKTIEELFKNTKGKYKLGIKNGIAPEDVLIAKKLPINKDSHTKEHDYYTKAQVCLNSFKKDKLREGMIIGSVRRKPSFYFFSENERENMIILGQNAKLKYGGLYFYGKSFEKEELFEKDEVKCINKVLDAMQNRVNDSKLTDIENKIFDKKIDKFKQYKNYHSVIKKNKK